MTDAVTDLSDICTACGLCCDGTLFDHAVLRPEDVAAATASGLTVREYAGKSGFSQPCRHLCGTSCGIYPDRPRVCRDYRCAMLKRVAKGEASAADLARQVAAVREAAASLQSELLPGETLRECRDRMEIALENPEGADAALRTRLLFGVLELLIDKHFRNPDQRLFSSMDS